MIDEIAIYRIVLLTLLVGLPVALIYIILPARNVMRLRIRWIAIAFIGIGTCFVGWAASWPGPNGITGVMMLGGLVMFVCAGFLFVRSFLPKKSSLPTTCWLAPYPNQAVPLPKDYVSERNRCQYPIL